MIKSRRIWFTSVCGVQPDNDKKGTMMIKPKDEFRPPTRTEFNIPNEKQEKMNENELIFVVFCIENVAECLNLSGSEVYNLLTERSGILDDYILPSYDSLHTQDKEYIVNDIIEYMREERLVK